MCVGTSQANLWLRRLVSGLPVIAVFKSRLQVWEYIVSRATLRCEWTSIPVARGFAALINILYIGACMSEFVWAQIYVSSEQFDQNEREGVAGVALWIIQMTTFDILCDRCRGIVMAIKMQRHFNAKALGCWTDYCDGIEQRLLCMRVKRGLVKA